MQSRTEESLVMLLGIWMSGFITARFLSKCLDMIIRLQSTIYGSSNILPSVNLYKQDFFLVACTTCM